MTRSATLPALALAVSVWLAAGCSNRGSLSDQALFEQAKAADSAAAFEAFAQERPESPLLAQAKRSARELRARDSFQALMDSPAARGSEAKLARFEREWRGTAAANQARVLLAERKLVRIAANRSPSDADKPLERRAEFVWLRAHIDNPPGHGDYPGPLREAYFDAVLPLASAAARELGDAKLMARLLGDHPKNPAIRALAPEIEKTIRARAGEWEAAEGLLAYAQAAPGAPALPELEALARRSLAERAEREDSIAGLKRFAELFPDSPEAAALAARAEEKARGFALAGGQIAAREYLERFPEGAGADEVRARLQRLLLDEAVNESYRLSYQGPLQEFASAAPEGEVREEAMRLLEAFEGERAQFENTGGDPAALRQFLSLNPDGLYAGAAARELRAFDDARRARELLERFRQPFDPGQAQRRTPVQIYQTLNPAVVTVRVDYLRGPGSQGSGFFVTPSGHVLTNAHVVDGEPTKITVYSLAGAIPCGIIAIGKVRGLDLALLAPSRPVDCQPVAFRHTRTCVPGERVFTLGTPAGMERSISEGIIAAKRVHNEVAFIQHTAAISSGSSGGPLFDEFGNVIGVNTSTLGAVQGGSGQVVQNVNFSIASEDAVPFIAKALGLE